MENELFIDPNKITNIINCKNITTQCEICYNYLNSPYISQCIKHAIEVAEIKFTNICHEPQLVEKLIKVINDECFTTCTFH